MRDRYGRQIEYVRISLTEACNFACPYCWPTLQKCDYGDVVSVEEWKTILEAFYILGVKAIRFTGGEPLLYKHLPQLVHFIKEKNWFLDISLTTNGSLLKQKAKVLLDAGISRLNISIDSLHSLEFKEFTGGYGKIEETIDGLDYALALPFSSIKVNTVLWKRLTRHQVQEMFDFWRDRKFIWRFIECMPFAPTIEDTISRQELIALWEDVSQGSLVPVNPKQKLGFGPATYYTLPNGKQLGLIFPMEAPYCDNCNRLRVTADGSLRLCLLRKGEISLQNYLRKGVSAAELAAYIRLSLQEKQYDHDGGNEPLGRPMWRIGG